jgi:hypothetical protein
MAATYEMNGRSLSSCPLHPVRASSRRALAGRPRAQDAEPRRQPLRRRPVLRPKPLVREAADAEMVVAAGRPDRQGQYMALALKR